MDKFLVDLKEFLDKKSYTGDLYRVSAGHPDGTIETLDFKRACRGQDTYSVSKMYTMTAIGMLFDRGLLDIDMKLLDILPEYKKCVRDERWFGVTAEMCLRQSIGLPAGYLDIDVCKRGEFGDDYLEYMFTSPLAFTPGSKFVYTDAAFYVLSCVTEKISGMKTDDFLWQNMFKKQAYLEAAWSHCPLGHAAGGTGLYLHSSDMARLGITWMNRGIFEGERYLSEEWCALAEKKGYGFDIYDNGDMYAKGGYLGQLILYSHKKNLTVAIQSYNGPVNEIIEFFTNYSY